MLLLQKTLCNDFVLRSDFSMIEMGKAFISSLSHREQDREFASNC